MSQRWRGTERETENRYYVLAVQDKQNRIKSSVCVWGCDRAGRLERERDREKLGEIESKENNFLICRDTCFCGEEGNGQADKKRGSSERKK